MSSIDPRFDGVGIIHKHLSFPAGAVVATAIATALGTGVQLIPIHFRWAAASVGSVLLTNGSSGASIWRGAFMVGFQNQECAWWDTSMTANNGIFIEVPSGVGLGDFDIWFTAVRGGAGAGALVQ